MISPLYGRCLKLIIAAFFTVLIVSVSIYLIEVLTDLNIIHGRESGVSPSIPLVSVSISVFIALFIVLFLILDTDLKNST